MRFRSSASSPPTEPRWRDERGLTLTEITIVMVLASLVMLVLLGFYINSQATWNDASSQAIAQRELTGVVERLAEQVHQAARAEVVNNPDPDHQQVSLFDKGSRFLYSMEWNASDSLLHETVAPRLLSHPAIVTSHVSKFQVTRNDSLVTLVLLELRTATGKTVGISSAAALLNRVMP